jgi:hypothetical protein
MWVSPTCTPRGAPCGAQVNKIKKGGKLANLTKVPYIGTRVKAKNLASSGKHHASLCFWYLGPLTLLSWPCYSLAASLRRYPGVIIHTDQDMIYATIKYDDGEIEELVLAKYIRFS